jgi:hypothetical protein
VVAVNIGKHTWKILDDTLSQTRVIITVVMIETSPSWGVRVVGVFAHL